jgi:hypothetical protein
MKAGPVEIRGEWNSDLKISFGQFEDERRKD